MASNLEILEEAAWRQRAREHEERAERYTKDHLERMKRGEKHPIEDFLFTYYNLKPAKLKLWHPGAGVALAEARDRLGLKYYADSDLGLFVDAKAYLEKRGGTVSYIETLFEKTIERTPSFGCFGLHEWAMVYRLNADEIRHRGLPLRLGALETDTVVETNQILCSHFDAYRFFTPAAAPLNTLKPTRENQPETEQAGCLHAGMDVYKWSLKLGPILDGETLLDAFKLARDIRRVDMQASPYDVSGYGLDAIAIETPSGKTQYANLQRGFAERGNVLRLRVLKAIARARSFAAEQAS